MFLYIWVLLLFSSLLQSIMTFWTSLLFLAFMATSSMASMGKQTYIIHMDRTKIGASDDTPGNDKPWYEFVTDSMSEILSEEQEGDASPLEILYTYETTISGFAVQLSIKQLESFKRLNGFLSAIPDEMLSLHTTHTPSFLGLEPGRGLWSATNLASDVIVGVVDTGIWPEHVSFEDSDMPQVPSRWKGICEEGTNFSPSSCNKKIIGARAFWKGYETLIGRINETADYRSPRDSNGHGTHTASTAAGNLVHRASLFGLAEGFATGMRFTSRVAAYKACWSLGCAHSDILAAIDRAVADGVDVLSLSLGGVPRPYYKDNVAIASFRAVQNGVFVTCSAGNSGPFSSTVENTAPWIMTVAASYTDRSFPTKVKLGNGRIFKGSSLYCGKRTKQLPLVYAGTAGGPGAQFCIGGSLTPKLVKGKIVACEQGINSRTEKGEQVKNAGGAGMLLLNTEDQGEELLADPHILPATSIGASAGKAITIYLNSTENPTASIVFKGTAYGNTAPVMAAFSSRGPGLVGQDVIKPDVTAPGVNILAAWSPMRGPSLLSSDKRSVLFNIISGTSMSCPHVSGVVALLKSVHKGWSPAAIKSALMTTAYTEDNTGAPLADISSNTSEPATAFAFGSGHVDPPSAVAPGLIYDIAPDDYLYYLCSLNYTSSQIALLSRGNFTCPRNSVLQPGDLNYPSFAVIFYKKAETENVTYKRTVTNVGNPWSSYMVEVEEPTGVSVSIEPRRLSFKNLGEKLSYKVRFTALPGTKTSSKFSFGSLLWISELHTVRSPIAVTWQ